MLNALLAACCWPLAALRNLAMAARWATVAARTKSSDGWASSQRPIASVLCIALLQLSFAQDSLNVSKIYQWSDSTLPGSFLYDNTYNAVWGYARDGREYGIIGSTMGTHIIDVTPGDIQGPVAFIAGNYPRRRCDPPRIQDLSRSSLRGDR